MKGNHGMKDWLKRITPTACIYYSIITFIYSFIIFILHSGEENRGALSALRMIMFFIFSFVTAGANSILQSKNLSRFKKTLFHATIVGLAFFLFILLPAELHPSGILVGIILYLLIYAVVTAILLAISGRRETKKNNEKEYTPMFKK